MNKPLKRMAAASLMAVMVFSTVPVAGAVEMRTSSPVIGEHMNNTADIKVNMTLEELTQPFAADLYYGRKLLSSEGQKAWDLALKTLLEYDNSANDLPRDKSNNTIIRLNYADAGIYPTPDDCNKIQSYLVRNEARMYHLKDWSADFKQSNGVATEQTFYIGNGVQDGTAYHDSLLRTEEKVSKLLSVLKDDMTIYQQIWAVQKAYQDSVRYANTGSPSDMRGAFNQGQAICGGYSKGWMYLLQRMGIEAIWVNGYAAGAHAWNYLKVNGEWYLADTTWGGKNWWLNGADYTDRLTNHGHYNTFSPMPELAPTSIPQAWADYPSIWLNVKSDALVQLGDDNLADDIVTGYGNIYGEDLSANLTFEGNYDLDRVGTYTVTTTLYDGHGNEAEATSNVTVADIQTMPIDGGTSVELYYNGNETWFNNGFVFKEHWNGSKTYDLPDADYRVFEAKVGILGSVRDNTAYGNNAKVAFKVEFLGADGNVIETKTTKDFTWWAPAETLSYVIPDGATQVRFTHTPKGGGNNHSGYADVRVLYYDVTDPAVDAEVEMLQSLFKTVGLKANGEYPTCEEWITLDQKLNAGKKVHIKNPTYSALMRRLDAMESAGIKEAVLSDTRVADAMQEFLAYAEWVDNL